MEIMVIVTLYLLFLSQWYLAVQNKLQLDLSTVACNEAEAASDRVKKATANVAHERSVRGNSRSCKKKTERNLSKNLSVGQ